MAPTGNERYEKENIYRANWEEILRLTEALAFETNSDKVTTLAHCLLDLLDAPDERART